MQAKRFIPERRCLSAAGRSSLCPFFSFFRRKKGAYVFDSLVEREKGREREGLSFFFFFLTIPVCHHSGRQRQKEAADRSVTSRNKSGIAQQRNDFGQDNIDAPSQLGFQRHALAKFTATKSWFKTLRHRRDEPSKSKDIHTSDLFSESSTCTCTFWVVAFCSRPDVSSRASDTLSVSQILADNFENVMVTYASIFTGPQAQIPSSPYQQGLGLVRGYVKRFIFGQAFRKSLLEWILRRVTGFLLGGTMCPPPLVFGAQKKPGLDRVKG